MRKPPYKFYVWENNYETCWIWKSFFFFEKWKNFAMLANNNCRNFSRIKWLNQKLGKKYGTTVRKIYINIFSNVETRTFYDETKIMSLEKSSFWIVFFKVKFLKLIKTMRQKIFLSNVKRSWKMFIQHS